MSASGVRQLYNMVAVPGFTYGAEVWYTSLFKTSEEGNTKGSVDTLAVNILMKINNH